MNASPAPGPGQRDGFESWELELAEREVRVFLGHHREWVDLEFDDLVQECLLHWWSQRQRYRANKGASEKTFMGNVVKAKLIDIERAAKAHKRGGGMADRSLDAPIGGGGEAPTLTDVVRDGSPGRDPEKAATNADLRGLIYRAARLLTPRQRRLLDGVLGGSNISELSRQLSVPRSTLHDELDRIQGVFRDEGLEEFLR